MTISRIFIQSYDDESILLWIDHCYLVPNVGENIMVDKKWYKVVERNYYYELLQNGTRVATCAIFVKEDDK